jgi:curved DNA-binding protein CbpA
MSDLQNKWIELDEIIQSIAGKNTEMSEKKAVSDYLKSLGMQRVIPKVLTERLEDRRVARIYVWLDSPIGNVGLLTGSSISPSLHYLILEQNNVDGDDVELEVGINRSQYVSVPIPLSLHGFGQVDMPKPRQKPVRRSKPRQYHRQHQHDEPTYQNPIQSYRKPRRSRPNRIRINPVFILAGNQPLKEKITYEKLGRQGSFKVKVVKIEDVFPTVLELSVLNKFFPEIVLADSAKLSENSVVATLSSPYLSERGYYIQVQYDLIDTNQPSSLSDAFDKLELIASIHKLDNAQLLQRFNFEIVYDDVESSWGQLYNDLFSTFAPFVGEEITKFVENPSAYTIPKVDVIDKSDVVDVSDIPATDKPVEPRNADIGGDFDAPTLGAHSDHLDKIQEYNDSIENDFGTGSSDSVEPAEGVDLHAESKYEEYRYIFEDPRCKYTFEEWINKYESWLNQKPTTYGVECGKRQFDFMLETPFSSIPDTLPAESKSQPLKELGLQTPLDIINIEMVCLSEADFDYQPIVLDLSKEYQQDRFFSYLKKYFKKLNIENQSDLARYIQETVNVVFDEDELTESAPTESAPADSFSQDFAEFSKFVSYTDLIEQFERIVVQNVMAERETVVISNDGHMSLVYTKANPKEGRIATYEVIATYPSYGELIGKTSSLLDLTNKMLVYCLANKSTRMLSLGLNLSDSVEKCGLYAQMLDEGLDQDLIAKELVDYYANNIKDGMSSSVPVSMIEEQINKNLPPMPSCSFLDDEKRKIPVVAIMKKVKKILERDHDFKVKRDRTLNRYDFIRSEQSSQSSSVRSLMADTDTSVTQRQPFAEYLVDTIDTDRSKSMTLEEYIYPFFKGKYTPRQAMIVGEIQLTPAQYDAFVEDLWSTPSWLNEKGYTEESFGKTGGYIDGIELATKEGFPNYYGDLKLKRDATGKEITKAFRKLAVRMHPDRNQDDPQADQKFMELKKAYDVLSDAGEKSSYDRLLNQNTVRKGEMIPRMVKIVSEDRMPFYGYTGGYAWFINVTFDLADLEALEKPPSKEPPFAIGTTFVPLSETSPPYTRFIYSGWNENDDTIKYYQLTNFGQYDGFKEQTMYVEQFADAFRVKDLAKQGEYTLDDMLFKTVTLASVLDKAFNQYGLDTERYNYVLLNRFFKKFVGMYPFSVKASIKSPKGSMNYFNEWSVKTDREAEKLNMLFPNDFKPRPNGGFYKSDSLTYGSRDDNPTLVSREYAGKMASELYDYLRNKLGSPISDYTLVPMTDKSYSKSHAEKVVKEIVQNRLSYGKLRQFGFSYDVSAPMFGTHGVTVSLVGNDLDILLCLCVGDEIALDTVSEDVDPSMPFYALRVKKLDTVIVEKMRNITSKSTVTGDVLRQCLDMIDSEITEYEQAPVVQEPVEEPTPVQEESPFPTWWKTEITDLIKVGNTFRNICSGNENIDGLVRDMVHRRYKDLMVVVEHSSPIVIKSVSRKPTMRDPYGKVATTKADFDITHVYQCLKLEKQVKDRVRSLVKSMIETDLTKVAQIFNTPSIYEPSTETIDFGKSKGQGRRVGGQIKGGMFDASLQGIKKYKNVFGNVPNVSELTIELLADDPKGIQAYLGARSNGYSDYFGRIFALLVEDIDIPSVQQAEKPVETESVNMYDVQPLTQWFSFDQAKDIRDYSMLLQLDGDKLKPIVILSSLSRFTVADKKYIPFKFADLKLKGQKLFDMQVSQSISFSDEQKTSKYLVLAKMSAGGSMNELMEQGASILYNLVQTGDFAFVSDPMSDASIRYVKSDSDTSEDDNEIDTDLPTPPPVSEDNAQSIQFTQFAKLIPYQTARNAYYWSSHDPDGRAKSFLKQFESDMENMKRSIIDLGRKYGASDEDVLGYWNSFKDGYLTRVMDYLTSNAKVASTHVTGRAGFNVRAQQKKLASAEKRQKAMIDFYNRTLGKIESKFKKKYIAQSGGELVVAKQSLMKAETDMENAKKVNKIIRSKKLTDQQKIDKILSNDLITKPELAEKIVRERIMLSYTSVKNKIKSLKEKIATLELKAQQGELSDEDRTFEYDDVTIFFNTDADRIQIFFRSFPSEDIRKTLKGSGFKWSRKNKAWQRQITDNTVSAINRIFDLEPRLPRFREIRGK